MRYVNNTSYYINAFICLGITLMLTPSSSSSQTRQTGSPVVTYFSTKDYAAGIQNYAISQDYRGLIYVANNLGLLEYDGTNWMKYSIDKGTKIRSVYPSPSGRIYIGAQNEIGYFFPTSDGSYQYHSLFDLVPDQYRNFNDIWKIHPLEKGCIFSSSTELFIYDGQVIGVVPIPSLQDFTFNLEGQIFAQIDLQGLAYLEDGNWTPLLEEKYFLDKQITGIIRINKENILISTYGHGLFLANDKKVRSWDMPMNDVFTEMKINTISRLKNGMIAIGTNFEGMYIIDQSGEPVYHFKKGEKIQNKTVISIFEDSFGNIWLGLNNGLAKIEWQSPFSVIDENGGLTGTGYCAYATEDYLYLGTNNGLYYKSKNPAGTDGTFTKVNEIEGQIYSIKNIAGSIIVGGHWGAYTLEKATVRQISKDIGWWTFVETKNKDLAIGGNYNGLYLLENLDDRWVIKKKYQDFNESSRVMEFDNDGTLWMTHGYKGVYSFRFSEDFEEIVEQKYYNEQHGFPSRLLINVFRINHQIIFAAETGIFHFDKDKGRFLPHSSFNKLFGNEHIREIEEDSFGNVYFIGTNRSGVLKKDDWSGYQMETHLFNKIHSYLNDDLENITVLDNFNIMFAAKEGFFLFNKAINYDPDYQFNLLFRKIVLTNSDSILFGGNFFTHDKVTTSQETSIYPTLEYANNSIMFSYSAIEYNQRNAQYRYKLIGFDKEWSLWTNKTEKEYTNLHEGTYEFQVEARDIYDNISPIQSYKFSVMAPWYRTLTAYFSYAVLVILAIGLSVLYSRRRHYHEKRRLIINQKRELNSRDNMLSEVSRRSAEEISKLKNEKLKAEIKHKNKELATNTLHILDKNEFIKSIKARLNGILGSDDTKVNFRLKKIINEIDKNMEDDDNWKQFEYHFDEVHGDFFKKLREEHPAITPQELKLSAYLRMNMTTKEIADMLRISVRGVEIGRYRLRKKLLLEKETNLVEYMMNY